MIVDMFAGGAIADNTENQVNDPERNENPSDDFDIEISEEFDKGQSGHEEGQGGSDVCQESPLISLLGSDFGQFLLVFAGAVMPFYIYILRQF